VGGVSRGGTGRRVGRNINPRTLLHLLHSAKCNNAPQCTTHPPYRGRPPRTRCSSRWSPRTGAAPCQPASAGQRKARQGRAGVGGGLVRRGCIERCVQGGVPLLPVLLLLRVLPLLIALTAPLPTPHTRPGCPSNPPVQPTHRELVVGVVLRHRHVEHGAGVAHFEHLAALGVFELQPGDEGRRSKEARDRRSGRCAAADEAGRQQLGCAGSSTDATAASQPASYSPPAHTRARQPHPPPSRTHPANHPPTLKSSGKEPGRQHQMPSVSSSSGLPSWPMRSLARCRGVMGQGHREGSGDG
jgi:hypothetical protein